MVILMAKSKTKTLQDTATILTSLLWGGMLGIYLLGFLTRRGDARAVGCGIICTMLFTGWTILAERTEILPSWLQVPFDLYYTGMISNLVMFGVGFLVGSLLPRKKKNLTNLTVWDQDSGELQ